MEADKEMVDILSEANRAVRHGLSLGAHQVEVSIVNQSQTRIEVRKSHVVGGDILEITGAGVRVYIGRSLGVASTSRLAELEKTVENAYHLGKGAPEDPYFNGLPGPSKYRLVEGLYDKELEALSFEDLNSKLLECVRAASPKPEFTVSGGIGKSVGESIVVNSLGVEALERATAISGYIGSKMERDGDTAMGSEPIMGRTIKEFDPVAVGCKAAEKAAARIGAKKVVSDKMAVILDFRSTWSSLTSIVGVGANGLNVALGTSYFQDKIGQSVASSMLTMVDNPFTPGGMGSGGFDDEGAASKYLRVLEKGVLKSFVTDSYSAGRLGIPNNGHARKYSLSAKPMPAFSNVHIAPGDWKADELLRDTKKGILVEDTAVGPSGASTSISSMVDFGFYVEDGEIKHPVKNTMVGTTVFDLLANIDAVTKELLVLWGSSSPTVRVANVRIAGGL